MKEQKEVAVAVDLLAELGVTLGFPTSSALKGSRFALRELRPRQGRSPLRVVYAFDPNRDAVLVIGGDKGGHPKFYERLLPKAERIWDEYLADLMAKEEKS